MKIPRLVGEQCRILYLPKNDNQVVLGVAGSGKSVEAVCRAIWMSMMEPHEKILLLTCNTEVNEQLKAMIESDHKNAHKNILVSTIYSYCQNVINDYYPDYGPLKKIARNIRHKNDLVSTTILEEESLLASAVNHVKEKYPDNTLWNKKYLNRFISNESHWIEDNNITTAKQYEHVKRIGRGTERISSIQRPIMYKVFQQFQNMRTQNLGKSFSFHDIFWHIPELSIPEEKKAKYIIIDEVQDVSPAMFTALKHLIKKDGYWSVFGDLSQNIFGQRISWSSLGLDNIKKQYRLRKNYRNSKEISILAKKILDTNYFDHTNNFIEPIPGSRIGGKIQYFKQDNSNWIKTLLTYLKYDSCAIIYMSGYDAKILKNNLSNHNIHYTTDIKNCNSHQVFIQSINKIKGLEFDNVIFYGIDKSTYEMRSEISDPQDHTLNFKEMTDDDKAIYAKYVYVAITRARNNLTIVYKNEPPHRLFPNVFDK